MDVIQKIKVVMLHHLQLIYDTHDKLILSLLCPSVKEVDIFILATFVYISLAVSCRPHVMIMFKSSVLCLCLAVLTFSCISLKLA
jgi:hypothetical protein